MKIARIEATAVELPTKQPHRLAFATLNAFSLIVVRITTDCGIQGLGEIAVVPHYTVNSLGAVKSVINDVMTPHLLGRDPRAIVELLTVMDRLIKGNEYAKAGIEIACWDISARALNVPVSALLGGATTERLPVLRVLGNGEIGPDIEEAERCLADKLYQSFLVKLGKGPKEENVTRALAIKNALGDRARVQVDANQGWDEPTAMWVIERLEDGGVSAVEQPVPSWNIAAMRRLTKRFAVPIIADEAVATLTDAMVLSRESACDAFSIKPIKHGGLYRARQVATIAEASGLSLFGGTMGEGVLGTAICAQLFATFPTLAWGCQLFGPHLLADDIVAANLTYSNFELVVPEGPGFGVVVDEDKFKFYSARAQ